MLHSWLAYLPPHLTSDLLAHPDISPFERVIRCEAIALFADISGFTPMSEALGNVGPRGTEELSQILNHTFGPMIDIIQSYGGSIGKFAGDALTVVFPVQESRTKNRERRAGKKTQHVTGTAQNANLSTTARRAIQCALEMQQVMAAQAEIVTSAGRFQLSMKIGLGVGSLLTATIGDPAIRLEYLLAGSAIDSCTTAEQHAPKGAVVVTNELLSLARLGDAKPIAPGFCTILRLLRRPLLAPLPPLPEPPPETIATIARYLPPTIVERLHQGQASFVNEHRTITTMFVHFAGFEYQDEATLQLLQRYLGSVVQISDQYGGYLRQVDIGDKGSLYIVLFGAPLAHEDDAERALLCALELRAAALALHIPTATGITTGRIFCGLVGSEVRREYAAIGDSVNLAARLMSAAQPDQILVDIVTRQRARTHFRWTELPLLAVKGKSTLVSVAALERRQQRSATRLRAPSYTLPMVGRQAELAHCLALIERAREGKGNLIGISAEAGMGKSRLVAEVMRSAAAKQLTTFTSECPSYGTHSGYLVWQPLLRALFGLSEGATDQNLSQITAHLTAIDPAFLEHAPLLNPILGTTLAENAFTQSLDSKLRKQVIEGLLVMYLRYVARQRPLLLILEDCHWIDELSRDVLLALAHDLNDVPLLLIVTFRPPDPNTLPPVPFKTLPHAQLLQLSEFSQAETEQLIGLKLQHLFDDRLNVPSVLIERISERAQGNPFYIDELLNLLHDRAIDVRDPAALEAIELPDSLHRLILSRIDRLAEGPKSTLKVASVVGRLFKAAWLQPVYPQLGDTAQVGMALRTLQQADLMQQERGEPELEYLFKHLITRDVAYESLALSTRAALHEQVGAFIEENYATELERYIDLLAHHYGLSPNRAKQHYYFRRAGDAAKAASANAAAISYYERLLPLVEGAERVIVWLDLAGLQTDIGAWQAAEQNAQAALGLAEQLDTPLLIARSLYALGYRFSRHGFYARAIPFLERALEHFVTLDDPGWRADTLRIIGETYSCQGDQDTALRFLEEGLQLLTAVQDQFRLSPLLVTIGSAHFLRGDWGAARIWYERALAIASEGRFLGVILSLQINLANVMHKLGAHQDALAYYQQSLSTAQQIGLAPVIQLILGNIGHTYSIVGQYQDALACLQTSLMRSNTAHAMTLGWNLSELGVCYSKLGFPAEAQQLFAQGVAACRTLRIETPLAKYLYERALFHLSQHNPDQALADTTEAEQIAEQLGRKDIQLNARLLRTYLEVVLGYTPVSRALADLEQLRPAWPGAQQQAAISYSIWRIDPSQLAARDEAAEHYRTLFAATPNHEYHERYQALTGNQLPLPTPLPAPPALVSFETVPIETLMALAASILTAIS